jgi:hypothetical protein
MDAGVDGAGVVLVRDQNACCLGTQGQGMAFVTQRVMTSASATQKPLPKKTKAAYSGLPFGASFS